ncbi:MAG: aquaporin, partial [Verrucomicrobia bacterium]|nr:aquaporin [Verrucomicrobiota bacterium]
AWLSVWAPACFRWRPAAYLIQRVGVRGLGVGSIWMGGVLFVLICMMGPLTMGCFNPARDIGPRLVGVLGGWGEVAWGWRDGWWVVVYVVSPVCGALMGALVSKWLFKDAGIVPDSGGAGHAT